MTAPKPTGNSAVDALQRQLWRARDPDLRARLQKALARVKSLYGIPTPPVTARDLDLKRRQTFVSQRHPFYTINKKAVPFDDIVL